MGLVVTRQRCKDNGPTASAAVEIRMMFDDQRSGNFVVADGHFERSGSGSDPFRTGSPNNVDSEPRTGPMVQFSPSPEPWTGPRSGSARFRFEPRF
jgi:hypothetical protein